MDNTGRLMKSLSHSSISEKHHRSPLWNIVRECLKDKTYYNFASKRMGSFSHTPWTMNNMAFHCNATILDATSQQCYHFGWRGTTAPQWYHHTNTNMIHKPANSFEWKDGDCRVGVFNSFVTFLWVGLSISINQLCSTRLWWALKICYVTIERSLLYVESDEKGLKVKTGKESIKKVQKRTWWLEIVFLTRRIKVICCKTNFRPKTLTSFTKIPTHTYLRFGNCHMKLISGI